MRSTQKIPCRAWWRALRICAACWRGWDTSRAEVRGARFAARGGLLGARVVFDQHRCDWIAFDFHDAIERMKESRGCGQCGFVWMRRVHQVGRRACAEAIADGETAVRTIGAGRQVGDGLGVRWGEENRVRRRHAVQHGEDLQLGFEFVGDEVDGEVGVADSVFDSEGGGEGAGIWWLLLPRLRIETWGTRICER